MKDIATSQTSGTNAHERRPIVTQLYEGRELSKWRVAHELAVHWKNDELVVLDSTQHSYHLLRIDDAEFLYRLVKIKCILRKLETNSENFYIHHYGSIDVAEVSLDGAIVNNGISRSLLVKSLGHNLIEVEAEFLNCHPTLSIGCARNRQPVYVGTGSEQFAILRIEVETRDATFELSQVPQEERITIVDVGGAEGLQLKWMLKADRISPVVFEPIPKEAAALRSVVGRIPGARVIEQALAHRSGSRVLYVAAASGCSSLRQPNADILSQYSIGPIFRTIREQYVDCVRYDELFANQMVPIPDVIKIDVQGCEFEVLLGFGHILQQVLGIELETHSYELYRGQKLVGDIVSFLSDFGFVLRTIKEVPNFDGDAVEFDAFFTKRRQEVLKLPNQTKAKFSLLTEVWKLPPYL